MTRTSRRAGAIATGVFDRVVDHARLAPSIHNTQPWAWFVNDGVLELWADRSRSLPATDPLGRNLVISCGTALDHALVAARAMSLEATVRRLPDPEAPDLLARIELRPGRPSASAQEDLEALHTRCTDRRRYTSWPVARARVKALVEAAGTSDDVAVVVIDDLPARQRIEHLSTQSLTSQILDQRLREETENWIDHGVHDGIPRTVIPPRRGESGEYAHRFETSTEPTEPVLRSTDGILVLATASDSPADWLATGETLSAVWLEATRKGLSVVPLSQVVDVPVTRHLLRPELPDPSYEPQIVVRLGWQEIGRSTLPPTPRRPLDEVLRRLA